MGIFSQAQKAYLNRGVSAARILSRDQAGMTLNYLAQHDVRAHLSRVFGYGNFDVMVLDSEITFAEQYTNSKGKDMWAVGARARTQVNIRNFDGEHVASHIDVAHAVANGPSRGECYDKALKSAASDAMKRACVNLGDAFGLSLYNNQVSPFVGLTLESAGLVDDTAPVVPDAEETP